MFRSSHIAGLLIGAIALSAAGMPAAADSFEYVRDFKRIEAERQIIVDSRAAGRCAEQTLAGARCLPADDFLGPHGRLAAFVDIGWLLGTAGLSGDETVLVVGDNATRRDFVAGVLHVMGQRRVRVLSEPVSRIVGAKSLALAPGVGRSITRERVFAAPAREKTIVFAGELAARLGGDAAPVILDGRDETEYWGKDVRAARGGHLPGADHLPATSLRAALARGERPGPAPAQGPVVVYSHNALEGFAFYTLARAGLGLDAAIYPDGWADWAVSGRPADALTHPDRVAIAPSVPQGTISFDKLAPGLVGAAMLAVAMLALGVVIGRRRVT